MSSGHTICFDLGRVLVRICGSWREAHAAAGLGADVVVLDELPAMQRRAVGERVHAFEVGGLTVDAFVAEVAELLGHPAPAVAAMLDAWLCGAYPGAVTLLDDLAANGHRLVCLSNTNARHWALMAGWSREADRLWPRFHARFASHELCARKPDAAIYAAVEARLTVAPHEITFFDDLPENVAAARARGWRAVEVAARDEPVREMRAWLAAHGLL